jgi:hypothetical protein
MFETVGIELLALIGVLIIVVIAVVLAGAATIKKRRRLNELARSSDFRAVPTGDYEPPDD